MYAVENGFDVTTERIHYARDVAQALRANDRDNQGQKYVCTNQIFQVHDECGGGLEVKGDPGCHAVQQQSYGEHQEVESRHDVLVVDETNAGRIIVGCLIGWHP